MDVNKMNKSIVVSLFNAILHYSENKLTTTVYIHKDEAQKYYVGVVKSTT